MQKQSQPAGFAAVDLLEDIETAVYVLKGYAATVGALSDRDEDLPNDALRYMSTVLDLHIRMLDDASKAAYRHLAGVDEAPKDGDGA